jgi:hypothetical protein
VVYYQSYEFNTVLEVEDMGFVFVEDMSFVGFLFCFFFFFKLNNLDTEIKFLFFIYYYYHYYY